MGVVLVPTLCVGTHCMGGSASCAGLRKVVVLGSGYYGYGRGSVPLAIPTQSVGTS
ncbi:MAG TPA: hypothetical protein ACFYEF_01705 [Candidatus Wunengus sp. YC63]|uniref:hypothetical protein n=1 Tax=Candidatus Wunengus sp. YC63 TaxID=3367699 RepID=UPI00402663C7